MHRLLGFPDPVRVDEERIEKLEVQVSENERRIRRLELRLELAQIGRDKIQDIEDLLTP